MFFYRPQFKVWLVSNWEVKADADDEAAWGRVQVFTFPNSHLGKEDTALKDRMKSPENLRGVLRWAVEGAMRWYALDRLEEPESIKKATEAQRNAQDYVGQWIDDCCALDKASWAPYGALRQSYVAWCKANDVDARRTNDFVDTLIKRFNCVAKRQAGTGTRGYQGIGVNARELPRLLRTRRVGNICFTGVKANRANVSGWNCILQKVSITRHLSRPNRLLVG
jgi:phage/plasmid-associated DNA primase